MNYSGKFEAKLSADGSSLHALGHAHVETVFRHATHAPADAIIVPDAQLLFNGVFKRAGVDLILSRDNHELTLQDYFKGEKRATLATPDGAHLTGDLVNALTGHTEYAQADGSMSAGKVIGHVTKLTGTATATRNGVSIILHQGDNVEKGDVVQSGSDSTLGVTFIDGTVFGLSSNARMVLNEMIYDPNGSNNSSLISLVAGTISFVAGETAKHGDMKVDTPVATMGIRGTAVLVEIDFTVPGGGNAPDAKFQVLVEPDGHTGSYILFDKNTLTPIATVNQAGQQINISQGQVTVTNAPLPPDIQKLINDVFTLKFTDANPKNFDHFTDSVVPVSLQPIMLANGTIAVPLIINVNKPEGASTFGPDGQLNLLSHIPGPPQVVAADGALIERLAVTHSAATDTVSGKINFVDINAGDQPTVSITFDSFTYENAQHKDVTTALTQKQLDDITAVELKLLATADPGNNNNGSATWTYSLPDSTFDFMANGEKLVLTYIARVDNNFAPNNETAFKSFTITITTGANDVPTISATGDSIFELSNESQPNPTGSPTLDMASGSITFADVDLTDRPTVSAAFTSLTYTNGAHTPLTLTAEQQADVTALEAIALSPDAHNTNNGTVGWSYSVADSKLDFLAAGEILTLTYTATVDDGNGGTKTAPITITITGTNDTPTISATTSPMVSVREDTPSGPTETASGSISFADVDLTDSHTVSANFVSSTNAGGRLGSLTATETHDTADGTGGAATWNYSVDNSAIQFLAEGQTVQETFAVTVDDHHGGTATQLVVVTIIGTNDAPDIHLVTSDSAATTLTETNAGLSAKGTLTVNDVDLADIVSSTVTTVAASGAITGLGLSDDQLLAMLKVTPTSGLAADPGDSHNLNWTFDSGTQPFDYLPAGQSLVLTYTVQSTDSSTSPLLDTQTITITIIGTNDAASITGTATGAVKEDSALTATGTLTVADLDSGEAHFQTPASLAATYGVFTFDAISGEWGYTLNNAATNVQSLTDGQVVHDKLTVKSADGTASQQIDVTITGTNDAATISGTATGAVKEDSALTAVGTLTVADVDSGEAHFQTPASLTANYGVFTFDANTGEWGYTLNNAASNVQSLAEGQVVHDKLTVTSADGTASQQIDVTITGTNDAATISGTATGAVKEDSALTAVGTLTVADVDSGEAHFQTPASLTANYGVFTFDANTGEWGYTLNNAASNVQSLAEGQVVHDKLTVTSADGTASQQIDVTITGTNDAAVISGTSSGSVIEAGGVNNATPGTPTATGTLTDADVDNTTNAFTAVTTAAVSDHGYGSFKMTAAGVWTYALNNSNSTVQALNDGQHLTDSFTVTTADGTAEVINVTINGTNDAAVISGTLSGSVEIPDDGPGSGVLTATGTLTDTDVDNLPNTFIAAAAGSATAHGYGSYQMTAAGVWTYTLNNSNPTVAALHEGQHLSDSFTVTTVDGTTQIVTVTVADDDPLITAAPVSGVEGSPIQLNLGLKVPQGDLNSLVISNVPVGAVLSDGHGHTFTASAGQTSVDVRPWTVSDLSIITTNDTNFSLSFFASESGGPAMTVSEPITVMPKAPTLSWSTEAFSEKSNQNIALPNLTVTVNGLPGDNNSLSSLVLLGIPAGQTVTDGGGHNHVSIGPTDPFNYIGWNFSNFHLDPNGQSAKFTITAVATSVDAEGNQSTSTSALLTVSDPAGVAGSEINLGLAAAPPDPGIPVTMTVGDLPSGWGLKGGVQLDDHTWTIQTNDVQSLTVLTSSASLGAAVLQVSESWTKPDGGAASALVVDNVETYAAGSPIYALAANDYLTGSSGADLFVFAQPISHDVIYSFEAASDKIDLVGFAGFADFSDVAAHLSDDGFGNAVLTLASDETITLHGVDAASLGAGNFEFDQQAVLKNSADMIVGNGASLPLSGLIENTGAIELNSTGETTDLLITRPGVTLTGAGHVVLSDSSGNVVVGTTANVMLTNVDNRIDGSGELGGGQLSIVNDADGIIAATSAVHQLTIDTGAGTFTNHGSVLSAGQGGLEITGSLVNDGVLEASAGLLTVDGDISGGGHALIDGGDMKFGAASDAIVQFSGSVAGTLYLDDVAHFTGSVSGFSYGDSIDLAGIDPALVSIDNSGSLKIHYGTGAGVFFSVAGNYDAAGFTVATDHHGGTEIVWNDQAPVVETDQVSLIQNPDGTTGIAGLKLVDSDSAESDILTVTATTETGSSVKLAASSGHLSDINTALDDLIYDPGLAPSTARVAVTVADSLGATDKVNFIFNDGPATAPVVLQGTADKDVIFGSAHGGILTGGGGQDQFVFAPTSGATDAQHTITDFVTGLDKINLSQFGNIGALTDLTELQQGNDTLITLDSHDSLLLKNVGVANLSANDFVLHPGSHA